MAGEPARGRQIPELTKACLQMVTLASTSTREAMAKAVSLYMDNHPEEKDDYTKNCADARLVSGSWSS